MFTAVVGVVLVVVAFAAGVVLSSYFKKATPATGSTALSTTQTWLAAEQAHLAALEKALGLVNAAPAPSVPAATAAPAGTTGTH